MIYYDEEFERAFRSAFGFEPIRIEDPVGAEIDEPYQEMIVRDALSLWRHAQNFFSVNHVAA